MDVDEGVVTIGTFRRMSLDDRATVMALFVRQ